LSHRFRNPLSSRLTIDPGSLTPEVREEAMAAPMRAARLHEPGKLLRIDSIERPKPRANDVLIKVKSCGDIPNMNAIFSGGLFRFFPAIAAAA
jgi:hypothetical protein